MVLDPMPLMLPKRTTSASVRMQYSSLRNRDATFLKLLARYSSLVLLCKSDSKSNWVASSWFSTCGSDLQGRSIEKVKHSLGIRVQSTSWQNIRHDKGCNGRKNHGALFGVSLRSDDDVTQCQDSEHHAKHRRNTATPMKIEREQNANLGDRISSELARQVVFAGSRFGHLCGATSPGQDRPGG
jgi:hypothetical protein